MRENGEGKGVNEDLLKMVGKKEEQSNRKKRVPRTPNFTRTSASTRHSHAKEDQRINPAWVSGAVHVN